LSCGMLVPSARGSRSQTRGSSAGRTIEGGRTKRDALMAGLILLIGSCDAFICPLGVTRLRLGSQNCCAFGDGRQRVDPSTTGLSQGRQRGMGAGIGALQMARGGDKEPAEERKSVEELKELMDKMLQVSVAKDFCFSSFFPSRQGGGRKLLISFSTSIRGRVHTSGGFGTRYLSDCG
jgi:hypothetical protein